MNQFETKMRERKERWEKRMERRQGSGHVWTGVLMLLIGAAALLRQYNEQFPSWVFTWQMLLITLGLFIGFRHRFHGVAWFILILVGGTFLFNDYFLEKDMRRNLWPIILIGVGAFLIFRSGRTKRNPSDPDNPGTPAGNDSNPFVGESYSSDDIIDTTAIFGGTKKIILSKNFKGGDIVNVFGGTELNLTQADLNGNAVLELTTIFGGTKLIVPANWAIRSEAVTIFGGIEDKRSMNGVVGTPEKTLVLKGTVIFGGIDIKSF